MQLVAKNIADSKGDDRQVNKQLVAADLFSITGSECFVDFNGIGNTADHGNLIILNKTQSLQLDEIQLQIKSDQMNVFE